MTSSGKVILVLSDGLRYDTAVESMGYLGHLVEARRASLYKVQGEMPSFSRPMYETIHTGLPVSEHGIVSNLVVRRSNKPNIFSAAVAAGRSTAAAAYGWFSELYNRAPFDRIQDREVDDPSLLIQHGRFYMEDDFPDAELLASAALLVRRFSPDYAPRSPHGCRQCRRASRLQLAAVPISCAAPGCDACGPHRRVERPRIRGSGHRDPGMNPRRPWRLHARRA